jgi:hypothetical protein
MSLYYFVRTSYALSFRGDRGLRELKCQKAAALRNRRRQEPKRPSPLCWARISRTPTSFSWEPRKESAGSFVPRSSCRSESRCVYHMYINTPCCGSMQDPKSTVLFSISESGSLWIRPVCGWGVGAGSILLQIGARDLRLWANLVGQITTKLKIDLSDRRCTALSKRAGGLSYITTNSTTRQSNLPRPLPHPYFPACVFVFHIRIR